MAEAFLQTERLILRPPSEGDADEEFRLLNSPQVMRHPGGPREAAAIAEMHARNMANFAEHGFGFFTLVDRASDAMVGQCGIGPIETPLAPIKGEIQVGWRLREEFWRRGLAFEAVRAVLDWAFAERGLRVVYALTSEGNEPSWRLMEKLGMERRAELDYEDPAYPASDNPTIVYALTAEQWREWP